ncbi:surface antigen BspA-like [Trichomonas vaginalis G3]|uniref:Surface antigen BspA-like n=1 Tax=Trichomonas vaginalis (strain ATCC PRA-98 / G3) TaxID=412133 RepID=A2EDK6_TRIV3|nr:ribonuclease inhibitor domain-containing protein [Trichomonas vaginalis G3]EAY09271.1 surface antigen BspA-like [Trichomonas vaginalis G3]KAI5484057.1 ribonuclease inhibitor domain-containing protein [Trichomonas vaginalis G3]|eukprot:XP_001321494.1 surface antigen BspA-like [Trichomonas vaginalis G3]
MGEGFANSKITSIKFLSSKIIKLPDYSFFNWKKIQSIEFNSKVISIGQSCFSKCFELREINLPDIFAISDYAFYKCINLEKISVPNVQIIGEYAFWHCDKLISIEFPKELFNIGQYCFANCKSLKNINIGNQLTKIPGFAFASTKLETFEITNKIMFVNGSSFAFCRNLKLIVHDDHPIFCVTSHELYIKSSMTVVCVFGLQEEIYEVSEGMKSFDELSLQLSEYDYLIRDQPFNDELVMILNSDRIPILKLPKSVISLDESAMKYCFFTPFSINKTGYKMINPTRCPDEYQEMYVIPPGRKVSLYKVFSTEMTPAS